MVKTNRNKQELQWQAEDDARTMARYQEILNDKTRMGRAVKVAKQQANDLNKRASAMSQVANIKTTSRQSITRKNNKVK